MVYKFPFNFYAEGGNDSPNVFDEEGSLPTNRVQSYTKTYGAFVHPADF